MSVVFYDSFDHYATADLTKKWTSVGGAPTIGAVGRNSTNGLSIAAQNRYVEKSFTADDTVVVGFAISGTDINETAGNGHFLDLYETATLQVYFAVNAAGFIEARRGSGTLLGTSTLALADSTYYYLEFKVKADDTTGTVEVRVNGTAYLSLTGQDTNNGGTSTINMIRLGYMNSGLGAAPGYSIDDVYIVTADGSGAVDFLGPVRAKCIFPDGAGASTDFTPSAGSNYQNVDEASQDGDTTYNSEATAGDHDTYTFGAVGVTGTVKAVQVNLMVRSDGAGAETIAPMVRISSTDYQGTTQGITTGYTDVSQIYETSPATAAAWTVTEIDGAEFGIKLVS